jgi:protein Tex
MTNIEFISKIVSAPANNIQKTVQLLQEDCTIPFISRYRKDQTGNLDEIVIEKLQNIKKNTKQLLKEKKRF